MQRGERESAYTPAQRHHSEHQTASRGQAHAYHAPTVLGLGPIPRPLRAYARELQTPHKRCTGIQRKNRAPGQGARFSPKSCQRNKRGEKSHLGKSAFLLENAGPKLGNPGKERTQQNKNFVALGRAICYTKAKRLALGGKYALQF